MSDLECKGTWVILEITDKIYRIILVWYGIVWYGAGITFETWQPISVSNSTGAIGDKI